MPKHVTVETVTEALEGYVSATIDKNLVTKADYARHEENFAGIKIAPVTYFYPDYYGEVSQWAKINDAVPAVRWVIANPNSGPGAERNSDYVAQIARATGAGLKVMAYISTRYSTRPADEVKAEVATYLAHYPEISGIFLDEGVNGWSEQAGQEVYYQDLYNWFKAEYPQLVVTVNPGSLTTPAMVTTADMLMTFEHDAQSYLAIEGLAPDYYRTAPRSKFWHCVYGVSTPEIAYQVIEKAKSLHVGSLYLTDKPLDPNPYGGLPAEWLWDLQINEFAPTTKGEANIHTAPGGGKFRISVADDGSLVTTAL